MGVPAVVVRVPKVTARSRTPASNHICRRFALAALPITESYSRTACRTGTHGRGGQDDPGDNFDFGGCPLERTYRRATNGPAPHAATSLPAPQADRSQPLPCAAANCRYRQAALYAAPGLCSTKRPRRRPWRERPRCAGGIAVPQSSRGVAHAMAVSVQGAALAGVHSRSVRVATPTAGARPDRGQRVLALNSVPVLAGLGSSRAPIWGRTRTARPSRAQASICARRRQGASLRSARMHVSGLRALTAPARRRELATT